VKRLRPRSIVFGPVASRRLGRSLGINVVPYKTCSYSCIYCQLGETTNLTIDRVDGVSPEEVAEAVERIVKRVEVDFATFVGEGEPTLYSRLGKAIELVKRIGVKVAVLTNGSLLWREDVRRDLAEANYVCAKLDAGTEETFRRVNRPHPALSLERVVEGLREFSKSFSGFFGIQIMLVEGVNDSDSELEKMVSILREIDADRFYVSIPTRPTALSWARPAPMERVSALAKALARAVGSERVALLTAPEGPDGFYLGEDVVESIVSITAVHPLRMDLAEEVLRRMGVENPRKLIEKLVSSGVLKLVSYRGVDYLIYSRRRG